MLKINAIKIDILAVDGRYGCFYTFQSGLNIVRGNNITGKSSMFQAIIYALGWRNCWVVEMKKQCSLF